MSDTGSGTSLHREVLRHKSYEIKPRPHLTYPAQEQAHRTAAMQSASLRICSPVPYRHL